jgi:hypothetical protein
VCSRTCKTLYMKIKCYELTQFSLLIIRLAIARGSEEVSETIRTSLKFHSLPISKKSFLSSLWNLSNMSDKLTRIAIVSSDKCKPKKCRQECKKSCPVVRMGKITVYIYFKEVI